MQHFTDVSLPAAVKITCLCTCRFALVYSCRSVSSQWRDERHSHSVQICLPAGGSQGMKRSTDVEKRTKTPKTGPKQRRNPFMWSLFSCCKWRAHLRTPTVSKCLFKGCKFVTSKTEDFNSGTLCTFNISKTKKSSNHFSKHLMFWGFFALGNLLEAPHTNLGVYTPNPFLWAWLQRPNHFCVII